MARNKSDAWVPHRSLITGNKLVGGLSWLGGEGMVILPVAGDGDQQRRSYYATTVASDRLQTGRFVSANLVLEKGVWHAGDE